MASAVTTSFFQVPKFAWFSTDHLLLRPFSYQKFPLQTSYFQQNRRLFCCCSKSTAGKLVDTPVAPVDTPVRIVAIVGAGSVSPLKTTSWHEVMLHTATRLKWIDEAFQMLVFTDNSIKSDLEIINLHDAINNANILITVAVIDQVSANWILSNSQNISNIINFNSSLILQSKLGGSPVQTPPFSQLKESVKLLQSVNEAWSRNNTDDIRFCLLLIINAYIRPVQSLQNLRAKGFSTLNCMMKNCGSQILNCLLDPKCRKALKCLNNCSPVDQVCNYRCIASYESRELEAFSLCVLQKHNCLELDAKIPDTPRVDPMTHFQGQALDHETAEDLFVGWLGNLNWSWRVAAGQNPAYDQFPCQYQLFYRGKAKESFWYEPIFQVRTLDGDLIWRRRKYRVKRGDSPGTFRFSVLDNGVVSNEFWTIVNVCDDLSWGLFHYHGAARFAGQSYTGAILVTPNGLIPDDSVMRRVSIDLERCGIKKWEMFDVDNCLCMNPPLGVPKESRLHSKINVDDLKIDM